MKAFSLLHLAPSWLILLCGICFATTLHAQIDSARLPMKSLAVGNRWVYWIYNIKFDTGLPLSQRIVETVSKDTIINQLRYAVITSSYDNSTRYERSNDTAIFQWKDNRDVLLQRWGIQTDSAITFQPWIFFSGMSFNPKASYPGHSYSSRVTSSIGSLFFEGDFFEGPPLIFITRWTNLQATYTKNLGIIYANESLQHSSIRLNYTKTARLLGSIIEGKSQGTLDFLMLLSSANLIGRSGDTIIIPVTVSGMKQRASIDTSAFAATLSLNASLLEPIGNTPRGTILNGVRTIPLSLPYITGSDSSQVFLYFRAAIGNDTVTALRLNTAHTGIQFTTTANNGSFRLQGNNAGGSQIRFYSQSAKSLALDIAPNPLSSDALHYKLTLEKAGIIRYSLINSLGTVELSGTMMLESGINRMTLPIQHLHSGLHLLVVQSNDEVVTKQIQILR